MCDYSLQGVTSRPAKVGDELTTRNFGTGTRGFGASEDRNTAVCLLPGTEVAFESDVQREVAGFELRFFKNEPEHIRHTVARFRQVNLDNPHTHHDALEFPDGQIVLLTRLCVGQHATVLQLPAAPRTAEQAEELKRVAVVA
jgi:hypothetical protein